MPASVTIPLSTVYGFLLSLARIAGTFVFVPLPGIRNGPEAARLVLSLSLTFALFPQWPQVDAETNLGRLAIWMLAEAALGITIGLAVSFVAEAFLVGAQAVGLQAGYAYASVVDPNTQADSGVLLVTAQLCAGMLFLALGFDREIVRIFARSLELHPPGTFQLSRAAAQQILGLGADMFTTGVRLAMPAVGLLLLVDVALALLGRINAQLQLITLAFPVKMLAALLLLAGTLAMFPAIYRAANQNALSAIAGALR